MDREFVARELLLAAREVSATNPATYIPFALRDLQKAKADIAKVTNLRSKESLYREVQKIADLASDLVVHIEMYVDEEAGRQVDE
jgi:hypothetical protein